MKFLICMKNKLTEEIKKKNNKSFCLFYVFAWLNWDEQPILHQQDIQKSLFAFTGIKISDLPQSQTLKSDTPKQAHKKDGFWPSFYGGTGRKMFRGFTFLLCKKCETEAFPCCSAETATGSVLRGAPGCRSCVFVRQRL